MSGPRSWLGRREPETLRIARVYRRVFGRWPNLVRPQTFSEKLLYKRLFDRRPLLKVWSDKLATRDYVRARLGTDQHLVPLIGVFDTPDEVARFAFPDSFVLKASHGSGWVRVFGPDTPRDPAGLRALATEWLGQDFGARKREWGYRGVPPRVMAETLLEEGGRLASDYKLMCFNGEPRLVIATQDRFAELKVSFFDMAWRQLKVRQWTEPPVVGMARPAMFDTMVAIARQLSAATDFVRVDLYESGGRVFVGELTNYHLGGFAPFDPPEWDAIVGSWWRVPRRYR